MKVLVVVAHADDEVLGCGGTMALHSQQGDDVQVVILADGVSSRGIPNDNDYIDRECAAENSCKVLGIKPPIYLGLPDNKLDSLPLLDIVFKIESIVDQFSPEIIYTHNSTDLNIDHRITYQALMTACRPLPGSSVKKILSFEVLSSTEWSNDGLGTSFSPNYFVDVTTTANKKMEALQCYELEMRDFPHSRSFSVVQALMTYRGASVGITSAEAFSVQRIIK